MTQLVLTADDLLAGSNGTFDLVIPPDVLNPTQAAKTNEETIVKIKPLTIGAFQLIMKAAKNDPGLIPLLMVKEAVVEPALSISQVKQMHIGLVEFMVQHIRSISGLTEKKNL